MEVKKCDRCGRIIENVDNFMDLRGDEVCQGIHGRFRKAFVLSGHLCEDCMNDLNKFMEGEEEPETEAPAETKETSKFVDMVLRMRAMMRFCDDDNDCEECPLYKLNKNEEMICGNRCVTDFVREFIIEAAKDPIVKNLVLRKCVDGGEDEEFAADDELVKKSKNLSDELHKFFSENVYTKKEYPEEDEKPVIEVKKVNFNEIMKNQELHDLFWMSLIFGLGNGIGNEGHEDAK